MKKLVIIPGGFHPFHAGHKALYDAARDAFPSADVYVAATADTASRPFPFEVKQKLARMAGIDGHRFIQVKSPFQAREITQHYDPNDTVLIFARSEKDRDSQPQAGGVKKDGTASYLQPYKRNGLEPMSQHGYMVYLPTVQFGPGMTSATEIRAKWPGMTPEQKIALVNQLYPDTQQKTRLGGVIVQMLDTVLAGAEQTAEGLGKRLAGAALAGALSMGQPAQAQSVQSTAQSQDMQMAVERAVMMARQKAKQSGHEDAGQWSVADKKLETTPNGQYRATVTIAPRPVDEAIVVNDPELGMRIRPSGGMGTWREEDMVRDLATKFTDMVNMLKTKNYQGVYYSLYKGRNIQSLVRALAELQAFQIRQGRRPMARGAEVDTTDYVEEKRAGQ